MYLLSSGPNTYNENETIAKYEIMDGAPVRGIAILSLCLCVSVSLSLCLSVKCLFAFIVLVDFSNFNGL